MIKGVMFDFDHTLYDRDATYEKILNSFLTYFADYLRKDVTEEEVLKTIQTCDRTGVYKAPHWEAIHTDTLDSGIFEKAPSYEVYYDGFIEKNYPQSIVPYDDAVPMLETLRAKGLKLGILTNGPVDYQREKVTRLGLDGYVDVVVVGDELPHAKPHASAFHYVCQRMGCKPEETVYIGDHPINDVDGARKAGLTGVWFRSVGIWLDGIVPAEHAIEALGELPRLIDEINAAR